ncbi:MAG: TolC family protein [Bacteroidota bacterium]
MRYLLITILSILTILVHAQEKRVLDLEECITIAIENNLNVQRSALNLQTAEVNLMQSNAQRFPSLTANGSFGYNWGRSIDPNSNLFVNQRINTNSVSISSGLPLIQGLQITNSIKQSKTDLLASELDLQRSKNDLSINVASFYLTVILNKELVENAKFQLESSKQQLDQTSKFVASGALPIADELQLESQVATNEVTLVNNQNNLDLSILDLKLALLLLPGVEIDVVVPEIEIEDPNIAEINSLAVYEYALKNQPEIQAADARVTSSSLALDVSKGALFPSLSLGASLSTNYSDANDKIFVQDGGNPTIAQFPTDLLAVDDQGQPISNVEIVENVEITSGEIRDYGVADQWDDNLRYSVSLDLFITILNGFNNRSNMQRAKINLQQSEINAKDERNILYQTIETAYRNALAASRTYISSQKQVAALQETFRAVENQYNNGAANFTDYQVANNNLFRAQSDLSRSKIDFIFRKKILDFYLGKPLKF